MCNDFEQQIAWADYLRAMQALRLPVAEHQSERDLPRADDVKVNDTAAVMRQMEAGVELVPMRFGFPPVNPRSGPVFNFRSEGRRFASSKRCLVPASAFFEFTGTKYPKAKHRFTLDGEPFLAIAGLWRDASGNQPPAFTMLTTAPGPDVAPYHNRQVAVLHPSEWKAWLDLSRPEAELLRPMPAKALRHELVRAGKA